MISFIHYYDFIYLLLYSIQTALYKILFLNITSFFVSFCHFIIIQMKNFKDLVSQSFPKILGIGKNYIKHINQMGGSQPPKQPVVFLKAWSSLVHNPKTIELPRSKDHRIDHEVELGVLIGKGGKNIKEQDAGQHIGGYFLAIDFTDRDFQDHAKKKGLPWSIAKGQDNFCPVSDTFDKVDPYSLVLELSVNDELRQKDFTAQMHFNIHVLISYLSKHMTLNEGDLILTGTPMGVGPVKAGDHVKAYAKFNDKIMASLDFKVETGI